ncbi:MAG: capsule assembly Wzi family protein [Paludibacter sp.]
MYLQLTITGIRFQRLRVLFALLILVSISVKAQKDTIKYDFYDSRLVSNGKYAPFWMQSRNYGIISSSPQSSNLMLGISKDLTAKKRLFDYGFKADVLLRIDNSKTEAYFNELFAQAQFWVFDFVVGAREEHFGVQDSSLSCGGFLLSQNARPMPKITAGIEHFVPVPLTNGFLEIKGAIAHGWFTDNIYITNQFLHHKYAYLKLGGKLPVHLQYGLDHVAEWGGITPGFGQQPTDFHSFISIFLGGRGGKDATMNDQLNVLGNHIISQSLRLDIDILDFKIGTYWQNLSEDGPIRIIGNTMNTPDGLWGLSIRNKKFLPMQSILFEYFNSTDQSGPFHDKDGIVYGGTDGYFQNGVQTGWSFYNRTIGIPLILSAFYNSDGSHQTLNNRVQSFHLGIEGDIVNCQYRFLSTFSKNYGTYGNYFPQMLENTSLLLELNKKLPKLSNIEAGCSIGADFGKLYGNSLGFQLSLRKRGDLFKY